MDTILIVDNHEELLENLRRAASVGENRRVIAAKSAAIAIALINEEHFDVVVTDVDMENTSSGIEVLEAAKHRDPLTQVIVVTAYAESWRTEETFKKGAFDYLDRTSNVDTEYMIRAKIAQALEFRRGRQAVVKASQLRGQDGDDPSMASVFLNVWFPNREDSSAIPVGEASIINVNLGPLMTSCLLAEEASGSMAEPHLLYTLPYVDVLVTSIGASVEPSMKRMPLPPGPKATVSFSIIPQAPEPFRITINVLINNESIHRSTFLAQAVRPIESREPALR